MPKTTPWIASEGLQVDLLQSLPPEFKSLPPRPTIKQAAEAIGVHDKTIRRRISEGTLVAYRIGPRSIRVDRDSLLQMISRPMGIA